MNLNIISDLRAICKYYRLISVIDNGVSIIDIRNNKQINLYKYEFSDIGLLAQILEPYSK